ncbi:sodium/calcium exchanger protein [Ditylenchus destructor]|nr:sodium/calcium exchanger protein [Ditylenchus destructor]
MTTAYFRQKRIAKLSRHPSLIPLLATLALALFSIYTLILVGAGLIAFYSQHTLPDSQNPEPAPVFVQSGEIIDDSLPLRQPPKSRWNDGSYYSFSKALMSKRVIFVRQDDQKSKAAEENKYPDYRTDKVVELLTGRKSKVDMTQPTFAQIVKTWLPTTQSSGTKQPVEDSQEISSGLEQHRSFWHRNKRSSGFYEGNFAVSRSFNRAKRQTQQSIPNCASVRVASNESEGVFPTDLFSLKQRQHGAIILHFAGLVYMFVALAIVCDEFFVPALDVIAETMSISDDVAGATLMAAGGSAPEFFTSLFGVFITENNVGVGTIVGSATFNILCVLAFCTLFSKTVLKLTWWPLFRDVLFYSIALLCLVTFFSDEQISWHEALAMFALYVIYAIFMKYNSTIEEKVKQHLKGDNRIRPSIQVNGFCTALDVTSSQASSNGHVHGRDMNKDAEQNRKTIPVLHSGAIFRTGIIHVALDPNILLEPIYENQPTSSRGSARQNKEAAEGSSPALPKINIVPTFDFVTGNGCQLPLTSTLDNTPPEPRKDPEVSRKTEERSKSDKGASFRRRSSSILAPFSRSFWNLSSFMPTQNSTLESSELPSRKMSSNCHTIPAPNENGITEDGSNSMPTIHSEINVSQRNDREHEAPNVAVDGSAEEPVDLAWPRGSLYKQCVYVAIAPIMVPLYYTLPDVKKPDSKKFAVFSFAGSILWIAFFSYLMVWLANTIGTTLGISTEVMGLTILAAGTSIPDLITSVIVSRKGLGDMAVSSSIGSNLFDICIGLPIPWLLYFLFSTLRHGPNGIGTIAVISNGLICSVALLFLMLIVLVASIAAVRWQMNKIFGALMILSYILFCSMSIALEKKLFLCPLRPLGYSC